MRVLACTVLLMIAASAGAEDGKLYRYVDPSGVVHFTDQPPNRGAKPYVLDGSRPLTTKRRWNDAASLEIIRNAVRFAVHWTLPSPGQSYPASTRDLLAVVSVMPGLAKGFGINFQVDGKTQNSRPIQDIHTTLHGIGAGEHELTAVLVSPSGQELARTKAISIEIKPVAAAKK